ncbi:MAG TPA: hypothetical protein PKJ99_13990 [Thermoanaerobaculales bacterium]|nr:hypothetical protein [Thermoanaerobaculales bacterium]
MSDDAKKPDDGWHLVSYGPDGPIFEDLPTDPEARNNDPMLWDGRVRTEDEMVKIVYEVIRKALRYPVMAGCYLGWGGTYGKYPYDVARLIIQEGPIDLREFIRFDQETMSWYLWTMAATYVHFGPERAHAVRERLRREALEAIEQGIQNSVQ